MARPEKHNADYFSHDKDMRNDPKIKALRRKYPSNGYSVYNMFLEVLTGADYFVFEPSVLNLELLAGDFDVDPEELEDILQYMVRLKLIASEDDGYFSPGLRKRLKPVIDKRNNVKQKFLSQKLKDEEVSGIQNTQSKVKYSKVKESKEIVVEEVIAEPEIFEEKNEEEVIPEIPVDVFIDEEEKIAAVEFLKRHSYYQLVQKNYSLKPPEVFKLFDNFLNVKIADKALKGKSGDEIVKNFYFWIPKYQKGNNQNTNNNGATDNQSGRNTGRASTSANIADIKRTDRKQLTDHLRGLLQGTIPE